MRRRARGQLNLVRDTFTVDRNLINGNVELASPVRNGNDFSQSKLGAFSRQPQAIHRVLFVKLLGTRITRSTSIRRMILDSSWQIMHDKRMKEQLRSGRFQAIS